MIEPTMKAIAPSDEQCRSRISTAAARLSTRPVIEIAFGVSRDSISAVAGVAAPLGAPSSVGPRGARCADAHSDALAPVGLAASRPRPGRPDAGERAGARRPRPATATRGAGGGVEPVVVGGDDDRRRRRAADRAPRAPARPVARRAPPRARRSSARSAMCMLGTAAYLLTSRLDRRWSPARPPVKVAIVSVKPSPGTSAAAPSGTPRSRPGRAPSRP